MSDERRAGTSRLHGRPLDEDGRIELTVERVIPESVLIRQCHDVAILQQMALENLELYQESVRRLTRIREQRDRARDEVRKLRGKVEELRKVEADH